MDDAAITADEEDDLGGKTTWPGEWGERRDLATSVVQLVQIMLIWMAEAPRHSLDGIVHAAR